LVVTTILSIDLDGALRKRKPDKRASQLVPRRRDELVDLMSLPARPQFLLLDTTIYIHRASGRLAQPVRLAIDQALLFHSTVALAELAVGVANADPSRPDWRAMHRHYAELFAAIPPARLMTPDGQVWIDAGVIAGTLSRTQGFQSHQRKECLNDALIFLTAAKAGIPVLTANRDEFDMIQQLAPEGRFLYC
jgi:predicted nucleic acid-binding protein